jgi:hypothetical protein
MKINNINLSKLSLLEYVPAKIMSKTGKYFLSETIKKDSSFILSTSSNRNSIILPSTLSLEPEDFIAIGLYFAEGEKYTNSPGKTKHSGQVSISNNNLRVLSYYCSLLAKLNIPIADLHYRIGLNVNYKDVVNASSLLHYWITSLKLNSEKKRPKWICYTGKLGNYKDISTSDKGFIDIYYASTVFRGFFLNFINKIYDICLDNNFKE